jgi:hypothetical protein
VDGRCPFLRTDRGDARIFNATDLVEDQAVKGPIAEQKQAQGNHKLLQEIFIHFTSSFLLSLL